MKNSSVLLLCKKVCNAIFSYRHTLGMVLILIATMDVHWSKIEAFYDVVKHTVASETVAGESFTQADKAVSFHNRHRYTDWMLENEVCNRYRKYYKKKLRLMRRNVTLADKNSTFFEPSAWLESMRVRLQQKNGFLDEDQHTQFVDTCENVLRELEQSVRVGFWELKYYTIKRSVLHICLSRPNLNCVMAVQLACHSIIHRLLVWYYTHFFLLVLCDRFFTAMHWVFPIAFAVFACALHYIDDQHMRSIQHAYTTILACQQHVTTVFDTMFEISVNVFVLAWKLGRVAWNLLPHISYLLDIIYTG